MKKIIAAILTAGFCASFLGACVVVETPARHGGYVEHRHEHRGYHRGY